MHYVADIYRCKGPIEIQMFEYLGKLMGVSLRTKMCLPFALADLVYKRLLGRELSYPDLKSVDLNFFESIDNVRHCDSKHGCVDDEMFTDTYGTMPFEVKGSDGEMVRISDQ